MEQKGGGGPRGQLPLNEETGPGVGGPGVGRRDGLGIALPACLGWTGLAVDLLCLGVRLWGGYRSAFDGVRWVYVWDQLKLHKCWIIPLAWGALFVPGLGPTFWEESQKEKQVK